MNKRPLSITIISWLFIALGIVTLVGGLLRSHEIAVQSLAELKTHWYVHLIRICAIVSGVFMLSGRNWARWLLVVWMGFHIIISILHSPLELVMHAVLFSIVLYFLFYPPASAFFRGASTGRQISTE